MTLHSLSPADRAHPYTFAELDALLAGRRFTFGELAQELAIIVPPITAATYLRDLAARGALVRTASRGPVVYVLDTTPAPALTQTPAPALTPAAALS